VEKPSVKITSEQVKAEVGRFWNAFTSKQLEALTDLYAAEATVFGSSATRPEPGRLATARREREYFHPQTTVRVTLGPIDVTLLGDIAAVASYTFQFHASKIKSVLGGSADEEIKHGRASQVFLLDHDGKLRIVHEHLSAVEKA
jgi:ketosteroid isomerase-like protein